MLVTFSERDVCTGWKSHVDFSEQLLQFLTFIFVLVEFLRAKEEILEEVQGGLE